MPKGVVPLPVLSPPKAPGKVCTNKSSTSFHVDDDGKFGQHHRYGSPDWQQGPDGGATVIEVGTADEATPASIADRLAAKLQGQADQYSEDAIEYDLSHGVRIELRFEFIDTDNINLDDKWLPFPAGRVLLAAEAHLVPWF